MIVPYRTADGPEATSGMDNFEVLNPFTTSAVDYILKPFDRTRFERAVQQAKSRIRQERRTDLTQHLGRIVYVKTASIEWVEAEGN